MSYKFEVEGGKSVKLKTAGKYCDRDIVVTATGAAAEPVIEPLEVAENGIYTAPDGVDGYSPVTVNVASGGATENQLHALLNGTLTDIDSDVSKVIPYACYGLTTLKTLNIPDAKSIGTYAFYNCTALTTANAPAITSLGSNGFRGCKNLVTVNVPNITTVQSNCFYSCSNLTKLDLHKATSIGGNALYGNSALKTLVLRSESVVTISGSTALKNSPIANGTGYIYVPTALVADYQAETNWSTYAEQFRALEDYTVDGTITGALDETKI